MVFNLLILFIVIGAIIISAALNRNKLTAPIFRKAFIFRVALVSGNSLLSLLCIASQLFGPYTHWVLPVFSLAAVPFVRMGYPNFLRFWKGR